MTMEKTRPDWLMSAVGTALLGNVPPGLRAVAARFDRKTDLTLVFYFAPGSGETDFAAMENAVADLESSEATFRINGINAEMRISGEPMRKLDFLDFFVFARHEP